MNNPKAVGEKSEAAILNYLIQKNIPVAVPWGNNQRYDLIVDLGDRLLRAQCKTGTYSNGAVNFPTSSKSGGKVRKNYVGQIDCFLVYCRDLDKVYKVDIGVAPKNSMTLRVDALKSLALNLLLIGQEIMKYCNAE